MGKIFLLELRSVISINVYSQLNHIFRNGNFKNKIPYWFYEMFKLLLSH